MINGTIINEIECDECHGNGIDASVNTCNKCDGKRCYNETITITAKIPRELHDKSTIIINNIGHEIPIDEQNNNITRSDVILIVNEIEHNIFKHGFILNDKVNYDDLMIYINISFIESLVGFIKMIKLINKQKIHFKIEEPVKHYDLFYIENGGMIRNNSKLYVKFFVDDPPKLSFKDKQRLWQIITKTPYEIIEDIYAYTLIKKKDNN